MALALPPARRHREGDEESANMRRQPPVAAG